MEHARQLLAEHLPWLMSAMTITAIELQGRKWPRAWALSLAGQVFWFAWIFASEQWGFLPMTSVLTAQYLRNHLRWRREECAEQRPRIQRCSRCVFKQYGYCETAGSCYLEHTHPRPTA